MQTINRAAIEQAEENLAKAEQHVLELKQAFAEQECPFEIGQRVTNHYGFTETNKEIIITDIETPGQYMYDCDWVVAGLLIRADGKVGKKQVRFSSGQYNKFKAANAESSTH